MKEINRHIEYTIVPDAPDNIVGLMNMRGQIVTLFDLSGMMGYELAEGKSRSTCILLKKTTNNPDYIGFLIDRPGSVIDIVEDICEPPPANVSLMENKFISEVAKLENKLLMIINKEIIFGQ